MGSQGEIIGPYTSVPPRGFVPHITTPYGRSVTPPVLPKGVPIPPDSHPLQKISIINYHNINSMTPLKFLQEHNIPIDPLLRCDNRQALEEQGFSLNSLYDLYPTTPCQCTVVKAMYDEKLSPLNATSASTIVVWSIKEFADSLPYLPQKEFVLMELFDNPGVQFLWYTRGDTPAPTREGIARCRTLARTNQGRPSLFGLAKVLCVDLIRWPLEPLCMFRARIIRQCFFKGVNYMQARSAAFNEACPIAIGPHLLRQVMGSHARRFHDDTLEWIDGPRTLHEDYLRQFLRPTLGESAGPLQVSLFHYWTCFSVEHGMRLRSDGPLDTRPPPPLTKVTDQLLLMLAGDSGRFSSSQAHDFHNGGASPLDTVRARQEGVALIRVADWTARYKRQSKVPGRPPPV